MTETYYKKHRDACLEYQKKYFKEHYFEIRAYQKEYYKSNKSCDAIIRKYNKKQIRKAKQKEVQEKDIERKQKDLEQRRNNYVIYFD